MITVPCWCLLDAVKISIWESCWLWKRVVCSAVRLLLLGCYSSLYCVSVLHGSSLVWFASAQVFLQLCFCLVVFTSYVASIGGVVLHCFHVLMPWYSVLVTWNLFAPLCQFCFWALVRGMADLECGYLQATILHKPYDSYWL